MFPQRFVTSTSNYFPEALIYIRSVLKLSCISAIFVLKLIFKVIIFMYQILLNKLSAIYVSTGRDEHLCKLFFHIYIKTHAQLL